MLRTDQLDAHYGLFQALFGVSITVSRGEVVALIGSNGAGKTTLLRTLAGAMPTRAGAIVLNNELVGGGPESRQLAKGVALVPEGRKLFADLTVEENLRVASESGHRPGPWTVDALLGALPALQPIAQRNALALSGGQQQLVAIARALASNPEYLLCDEVSLGLSPVAVQGVYELLRRVAATGTAVLLVEQNVSRALAESSRYYCLQKGRVVLEGESRKANTHDVAQAYFGAGALS